MANNFDVTLPRLTLDLRTGTVVAGTIARPTVDAFIRVGTVMSVAATYNVQMTLQASFRGLTASLTLPKATAGTISATIPNLFRATPSLPKLVSGGISATLSGRLTAAATLPRPTVAMTRGSAYAPVLPVLQGAATIVPNLGLGFALTLPTLRGSAGLTNSQGRLRAHAFLPALQGISGSTAAAAQLPALQGAVLIVAGTQAVRTAWAMNVTHLQVTQFTNFPFRAFARAYNRYYAAGLDAGLFRMGGDKDVTAAIAWEWRTGLSDVGSRAGKGVLGLYLDGVAERGIDFVVQTDRGAYVYDHQPHGTPNNHQTQRVSVGKSLRSVNWAFGMKSTKGAYFEIDSLTPEWQLSDRNVF